MHLKFQLFCVVFFLSSLASGQTADEVIRKYIKYCGGEKAWKKVRTITTSGEYDYGGIVFPFNTYSKAPDAYKFVVPFNGKYYAQAFDGKKGWKIDAFKNETVPTHLTGKAALAMANEADVELESPFIDYRKKGHQVTLVGTDSIQGNRCFNIRLVRKNGEVESYYFDHQTSELVMKIAPSKNAELEGSLLSIYFRDYRKVDGIKIPFNIICQSGEQMILAIIVSHVAINTAIDDGIFQP